MKPLSLPTKIISARRSLEALRRAARPFLIDNPCIPARANTVWVSDEMKAELKQAGVRNARNFVAKKFGYEIVPMPGAYLQETDWQRILKKSRFFPSDSYLCHGGVSHGSGRSIFIDDYQIKGVGRTQHAVFHDFFKDTNGLLTLEAAVTEICNEKKLSRILSMPPIRHDFLLAVSKESGMAKFSVSPDDDYRFLLGRQGSPLRVGHLHHLLGAGRIYRPVERCLVWRKFFCDLFGLDARSLTSAQVMAGFRYVLDCALCTLAEVRLFGIFLSNWEDNADLFSRTFDCEGTRFRFDGTPEERGFKFDRRKTACSQLLAFSTDLDDGILNYSLQTLANAFRSIAAISDGIEFDLDDSAEDLNWGRLEKRYLRALRMALGKLLGCEELIFQSRFDAEFAAIARSLAFVPSSASPPNLNRPQLIAGYRDGLTGNIVSCSSKGIKGIGRELGNKVASQSTHQKLRKIELSCRRRMEMMRNDPRERWIGTSRTGRQADSFVEVSDFLQTFKG